jgi:hypothetical protein
LDFDEDTAGRNKLDVARIKLATSFRGFIVESIKIKALEVVYTIWVEEEKTYNPLGTSFRNDDPVQS